MSKKPIVDTSYKAMEFEEILALTFGIIGMVVSFVMGFVAIAIAFDKPNYSLNWITCLVLTIALILLIPVTDGQTFALTNGFGSAMSMTMCAAAGVTVLLFVYAQYKHVGEPVQAQPAQ